MIYGPSCAHADASVHNPAHAHSHTERFGAKTRTVFLRTTSMNRILP